MIESGTGSALKRGQPNCANWYKVLNQQAFIQEKQAFVSGCRSDERTFAITLTELSNRTMQERGVA